MYAFALLTPFLVKILFFTLQKRGGVQSLVTRHTNGGWEVFLVIYTGVKCPVTEITEILMKMSQLDILKLFSDKKKNACLWLKLHLKAQGLRTLQGGTHTTREYGHHKGIWTLQGGRDTTRMYGHYILVIVPIFYDNWKLKIPFNTAFVYYPTTTENK